MPTDGDGSPSRNVTDVTLPQASPPLPDALADLVTAGPTHRAEAQLHLWAELVELTTPDNDDVPEAP